MVFGLFKRRFADPADELIHWLADKNPDDRRLAAASLFGGPFSQKVYRWLLTRADCDTGTAAMMLWECGLPYAVIRGPSPFPLENELKRGLIDFIVERWRGGGFADTVFAYDPRLQAKHYRQALARLGMKGTDPFGIPDEAWRPIPGRQPAGTEATAFHTKSGFDDIRGQLRLADLAAINPADWEEIRRKSAGDRYRT